MKFCHELGQFGQWIPGKQITASRVKDIPEPTMIGPYRNIVIHTGINNSKLRNKSSQQRLIDELHTKCQNIMNTYPISKILLALVVPTKSGLLNQRAKEFNNMLLDLAQSYRNMYIINY